MSYTYILCSCNSHKERQSASLMYTFKEGEDDKVLDYIKANLNAFFDGTKHLKKQRFSEFFKSTLEKQKIADAINSNLDIYAMVQQIPNL